MKGRILLRAAAVCCGLLWMLMARRGAEAVPALLGWHFETIDAGAYPALALDAGGRAHVAYYDAGTHDLHYAVREAGGWQVEVADGRDYVGLDAALAVDADGYAHISHSSGSVHRLYYTYRDATGWHSETVVDGTPFSRAPLLIDGMGGVHLLYIVSDASADTIVHAVRDGASWAVETVATCVRSVYGGCGNLDAALDGTGAIHAVFSERRVGSTRLMVAAQSAGGWTLEPVSGLADLGVSGLQQVALDVDGSGRPHISFSSISSLRYAFRDETGWHSETIAGYYRGLWNDIGVSEAGNPMIAYYDPQRMKLNFATRYDTGWQSMVLDDGDWVGHFPSLALEHGYPAVVYQDPADDGPGQLRFAFLTPLDIWPGILPNVIDVAADVKIPIAVLGTPDLDVTEIDVTTATLGPGGAKALPGRERYKDVDQDGDMDLLLFFRSGSSGIACGDRRATVQAQMSDGRTFRGWDEIVTVGCTP